LACRLPSQLFSLPLLWPYSCSASVASLDAVNMGRLRTSWSPPTGYLGDHPWTVTMMKTRILDAMPGSHLVHLPGRQVAKPSEVMVVTTLEVVHWEIYRLWRTDMSKWALQYRCNHLSADLHTLIDKNSTKRVRKRPKLLDLSPLLVAFLNSTRSLRHLR